ncbi:MAG: restriction endonuclease subunit S [Muribaculaceae bacterium]|nr:restriction endonuclease subunit S [Muribaculaceae bacterium]
MGEIGTFIRGKRFVRSDIQMQGVPCIHYGDMYTHYGLFATATLGFLNEDLAKKMRFANKNDIVIVAAGENKDDLGNALAWMGEEPAAVHDACFIFRSNLNPHYLSHICRSSYYHKQIKMFANEAKICSVSGTDLAKIKIPVPPIAIQEKIAKILDRFEALVNDLSQGLPAEIAAVKEQYEYYRNKLLTFKKIA